MKLVQLALVAAITFTTSSVFARGVEVSGKVKPSINAAEACFGPAIGMGVTAEQTTASIRGDVNVNGDVKTVAAKDIINAGIRQGLEVVDDNKPTINAAKAGLGLAIGMGAIAKQTISSIDEKSDVGMTDHDGNAISVANIVNLLLNNDKSVKNKKINAKKTEIPS